MVLCRYIETIREKMTTIDAAAMVVPAYSSIVRVLASLLGPVETE